MPMPAIPPLYIRPFMLGNEGQAPKTSVTAPLGVAKCLKTSDTLEKNFNIGGAKGSCDNPNALPTNDKMPDKLGSIHSKLFAEAEKIQKWKTSVEIEQQQKERKLQDSYRVTDSLRKDVLDLQLQNESLRMQLGDEVQNRNDLLQKHQSTRELCIALKKHFEGLEEKIEYNQRIKENYEVIENQRVKAFEGLAEKFDALRLTHMEQVQTFNNIITSREREMNAMREACNNQLSEANKQLEYVNEARESKERDIMKLSSELKEKGMFCDNIALEKKQLLLQVSSLKESNCKLAFQLQEINEHVCKIQAEKLELEAHCAATENHVSELQCTNTELKDQFLKYQKENEEKISSLEINLKDTKRALSDEKENVAKQQTIVEEREILVKSLCDNQELLEQQVAQLNKDGLQLQEKIKDLEEEMKNVRKERDDFCNNYVNVKLFLSEKESVCTSLHTEINAKEEIITSLNARNDELRLQMEELSSQQKARVNELEDQLKHIYDEKSSLNKDFEQTKMLLSVKESLCDSLSTEVDDKLKEISNLVDQNNKLDMQIKDLLIAKDISSNQEESLAEELKIAEKRYQELSSATDELERKLTEKQKELADATIENETKLLELNDQNKCLEESFIALQNELSALQEELQNKKAAVQEEKDLVKKLEARLEAKEREMKELENKLLKQNSDLSTEQLKSQSFMSAFEEGKLEIKEMQMKLDSVECIQAELMEENSKLKISLCEVQNEWKLVSVALEAEKTKLKSLEEEITSKDSTIVLLESKITSLEGKIKDLDEEKNNQKEAHALQIKDMMLENEKSHELIALHEKSQNDYRKDSIEKERKLRSLQGKIQKLEDQLRFASNSGEVENLKTENSNLKELMEKMKAELELKKKETQGLTSKPRLRFKVVENQNNSASETVKIETKKISEHFKTTGVSLPQKRVGIGKPMKAASHQATEKSNAYQGQDSGNKKLKLGDNESNQNAFGSKNVEEKRKSVSTRKFFKSHCNSASQKEPDLKWFDMDPMYGFFE